jgi:hypothetical protein
MIDKLFSYLHRGIEKSIKKGVRGIGWYTTYKGMAGIKDMGNSGRPGNYLILVKDG